MISDFTVDLWIDRRSGTIIDYRDEGLNYYVHSETGERVWQLDTWSDHFTEHVVADRVEKARTCHEKYRRHRRDVPGGLPAASTLSAPASVFSPRLPRARPVEKSP